MAESYSTSLRLTLIGDGDLSGTWGDVTNANIGTLLEEAICGVISVPMGDTNYTLQSLNGVKDQARAAVIVATGANTAVRQVIAPLVPKLYILNNSTTGGYNVTIGGSTGSVVTVPAGQSALVYCDGTNFYNGITVAASAATTLGGGAANQILYQASTSNTQFITAPTTANSFLYWTGSSFSWSTISATLTVGLSAISGGTSGYVLYNNGGVLGNSAVTGSGTVVLDNSPSFTGTPTFASAPTVGGYSVLTTNTGVSAGGNNTFTGTNSFSTAPTVGGYSVVTTNNLSGYAQLSGTNNFTGANNYSSTASITATGTNAGNQRIGVTYSTYSSGLSAVSLQLAGNGVGVLFDTSTYSLGLLNGFGGGSGTYLSITPISGAIGLSNNTLYTSAVDAIKGGSSTAWIATSDIRLKNNIQDYTKGLDLLNQIKPRTWVYNGKGGSTQGAEGLGVVADEIEQVLPSVIRTIPGKLNPEDTETTDIKHVDTTEITWLLVNAVKELSAKVTALEEQILNLGVK